MSERPPEPEKTAAQQYAEAHKEEILKKFCPTFCFSKGEYSFPTSVEKYTEEVLRAKMKHYGAKTTLTTNEQNEYDLVKKFFPTTDKSGIPQFTMAGFDDSDVKGRLEHENTNVGRVRDDTTGTYPTGLFLSFEEKKLGYAPGTMVPIYDETPKSGFVDAPVYTSYVPTEDGVIIRAECFYPLSGAIPGTRGLYEMMPEAISKKFNHFAVHPGDWEGVYIKVKIDDGMATVDHMQTFAHGRSGARKVDGSDLVYDENGAPCVFVGEATHPSYAENFAGRNKFLDKVGDHTRLDPRHSPEKQKLVDLSPEAERPAWTAAKRWGDCDLMTHKGDYVKDGKRYANLQSTDQAVDDRLGKFNYHPISENKVIKKIRAAYQKAKEFVLTKILKQKPVETPQSATLDLKVLSRTKAEKAEVTTPGVAKSPELTRSRSFVEQLADSRGQPPATQSKNTS